MHSVFGKSRIDRIQYLYKNTTIEVDMLRDDLIHPLISGNKWRKLKYIIDEVQKSNKKGIVSFGGAYSNHLVALAAAGLNFGIETYGFIRGNEKREMNAFEITCIEHGMKLIHVSRDDYRNKEKLYNTHFADRTDLEMVGEGGRHPLALIGCAEILEEIDSDYDYIILSVGTGTTIEGIVKASAEKDIKSRVIGISSLKGNYELDTIMQSYPDKYWQIEHHFHRGKYGANDSELIAFINQFYSETGIKLEFVYTGKMLLALSEMIVQGKLDSKKKILAIHTGGLPQLL